MTIYLKITLAMLMSAGLIETKGWLGDGGYGQFIMAFLYGGMLLLGSFYLITAAEKYLSPEKIGHHTGSSEKENQVYHSLFDRNKNRFQNL